MFLGNRKRIRERNGLGGTVGQVVHSYGSGILLRRSLSASPILLPSFSYRVLERDFTAHLYRSKVGVGIVRSVLNRISISAAVSVCISIVGSAGGGRLTSFSNCVRQAHTRWERNS